MTKNTFAINTKNMKAVGEHIQEQFSNKSWWPTQGPMQAKEEFEQARHNPSTLADWCAKWLDGSQWKQLQTAVTRPDGSPNSA